MRLCGLLRGGGGQVCTCVQSIWQTRGIWGLVIFDFGPFI